MSKLVFLPIEWTENDIENEEGDINNVIFCYGRLMDGKSVYIEFNNFIPHFYIKVDRNIVLNNKLNLYYMKLQQYLSRQKITTPIEMNIVSKKDFYFYSDENDTFIKLNFSCNKGKMYAVRIINSFNFIINGISIPTYTYEKSIKNFTRMLHYKNIKPHELLEINTSVLSNITDIEINTDYGYSCDWTDIKKYEGDINLINKLYQASYDIECVPKDHNLFPCADNPEDKIIQIGVVFNYVGSTTFEKYIICLNEVNDIEDARVICVKTEVELIQEFINLIYEKDPDILVGYNVWGFDDKYIYKRAEICGVNLKVFFSKLGRTNNCFLMDKKLSSAGLGDNIYHILKGDGRINIDLMQVIKQSFNLIKYGLDDVAEHLMVEKIIKCDKCDNNLKLYSKDVSILLSGNFIKFIFDEYFIDTNKYDTNKIVCKKYKILDINYTENYILIENEIDILYDFINTYCEKISWCMVKNDMPPRVMFEYFAKGAEERKTIAEYCIQDCILVSRIIEKIDKIIGLIMMGNVCFVSINDLLLRGQGIKSLCLVSYETLQRNYLIPDLTKPDDIDNGYEGAIVLDAKVGFYKEPIIVLDYNSLYPSSIISKNISHETLLNKIEQINKFKKDGNIYEISYIEKDSCITKYFIKTEILGIIPSVLMNLLNKRKIVKKLYEKETNAFKKSLLNSEQNALKLTANALYGLMGAPTSPIYLKEIAACTTSVGRSMLLTAKDFVETKFPEIIKQYINVINTNNNFDSLHKEYIENSDKITQVIDTLKKINNNIIFKTNPDTIYGDTDSIFVNLNIQLKNIETYKNELLNYAIEIGGLVSIFIKKILPFPHNLEYEKTFYPFFLLAKKRYCGNKYESNINKFVFGLMGIAIKRRDNAEITKKFLLGLIKILLNDYSEEKIDNYINTILENIFSDKYDINNFVTTKKLKLLYKGEKLTTTIDGNQGDKGEWKWNDVKTSLVHVNICQRLLETDPGNCPGIGDRIPYVYFYDKSQTKHTLQKDCVELLSVFIKKNYKINYMHYLENQIKTPSLQFLELINDKYQDMINNFIQLKKSEMKGIGSLVKSGIITICKEKERNNTNDDIKNEIIRMNQHIEFNPFISKETKKSKKISTKKQDEIQHFNLMFGGSIQNIQDIMTSRRNKKIEDKVINEIK